MGSVQRRGETWQARYRTPEGATRSKAFRRKVDAEQFLAGIAHRKLDGSYIDARVALTPFEVVARDWLSTKSDVSSRTLVNVEGRLRNHVVPAFGGRPVSRIEPVDVRRWVAAMVADGLAPSTVRATYNVLSAVMAQAETDRMISRTPCLGIKLPADAQGAEMRFLTPDQVATLADAVTDQHRAAVLTSAYTGLRAGELWALQANRLDLLRGEVEVVESVSEVGGRLETGPTKTRQRRTVALPRFLAQVIGEHMGEHSGSTDYVFTSTEGGPVRHRNFMRRHFTPATTEAGLPGLRWHDLRHTCAAMLIAQGHSLHEVKDQLGHSSIRVTSDRYGHLYPEARAAMAASLDALYSTSRVHSVSKCRVVGLSDASQAP